MHIRVENHSRTQLQDDNFASLSLFIGRNGEYALAVLSHAHVTARVSVCVCVCMCCMLHVIFYL